MTLEATLRVDSGTGPRQLQLADYLDANGEEDAANETYTWIKSLRHARVGGEPLRRRFTYRGDSLWWFAELYLHKERRILTLFRALHAAEALIERERPLTIGFTRCDPAVRVAVSGAASVRQIRCESPSARPSAVRLAAMDLRSAGLALAAMTSPGRPRQLPAAPHPTVAAFIHRAFWKAGSTEDGSAESYIGPVLRSLETRLAGDAIRYVGVGPSTNFRARRWWKPAPDRSRRVVPIEHLVPRRSMGESWRQWAGRHRIRRELAASEDLRRAAVIRGCDCWPIVREALDGIALLQFPWSARAMDEAAAALDVLHPRVAVTYAEAGGWGRALALEARRRGVPLVGLQHGFIYRHWLNYRHEADEMTRAAEGSTDVGFPRPTLTLVFDEYAAQHLVAAGRFPRESIAVTGSPRLDALAIEARALPPEAIEHARQLSGARRGDCLVLIVSKYVEIKDQLPPLLAALGTLDGVQAVIKTHPAETPAPYEMAAATGPHVRVLPAAAPLAPLLRAARAVVTVNSTVAIDALVFGIPALAVGLPNNLSPFVDAGAMAGTSSTEEIAATLRRVLYDEGFRQQLRTAAAAVTARYRIAPDGRSAERAASAILELAADANLTGRTDPVSL